MTESQLEDLWMQARYNVGDPPSVKQDSRDYCTYACCNTETLEMEHARRDAMAGNKRAIRYWTEFTRLRMTT